MNFPAPQNVCIDKRVLRWTPVEGAHKYNVHHKGDYVDTVHEPFLEVKTDDTDGWEVTAKSEPMTSLRSEKAVTKMVTVLPDHIDYFTDLDNWIPRFPYWDKTINNELQTYVPDAFSLDNCLTINAEKVDGQWTSGLLSGHIEDSYLYGYFEADIALDVSQGMLPAFWLLNTKYVGKRPEIDILEVLGHRTDQARQNYHWWNPSHRQLDPNPIDIDTTQFHKYGLRWEPNKLTWFIDGLPVNSTEGDHVSDQEMYPILNLAIGGNWPGNPDDDVDSAAMHVRYFSYSAL